MSLWFGLDSGAIVYIVHNEDHTQVVAPGDAVPHSGRLIRLSIAEMAVPLFTGRDCGPRIVELDYE